MTIWDVHPVRMEFVSPFEPSLAFVILAAGVVLLHASEPAVVEVVDARGAIAFRLTTPSCRFDCH